MGTKRKRRAGSSDDDDDRTERRKKQKRDYATRRREQDKKLLVNLDTINHATFAWIVQENRQLTRQSSEQRKQIGQLKMWANYAKSYLALLVAFSHQRGAPSAAPTADQGLCPPDEGDSESLCSPSRISDGVYSPDRTVSHGFCSPQRSFEDGISLNDSEEDLCAAEDASFYGDSAGLFIYQAQEAVLDFGNIIEPLEKAPCAMANQSTLFQDLSGFVVSEECVTHAQWVPEAPASRKCSYESVDSEGSISSQTWSLR